MGASGKVDPALKAELEALPEAPGVYLFRDGAGSVLYVGKAKNLRNRVRAYFNPRQIAAEGRPKVGAMIRWIRRIETIVVKTEAEALILEGRLLKEYKPKYNTDFVDDKRFLFLRVDASALPRFMLERNRIDPKSNYYGPFVHGAAIKKIYFELRKKYGVLLGDARPQKLPDGRWQLYDDARAEIFGSNEISREEYLERVVKASAFLEGQTRLWREEVAEKMRAAAEARRYEEAAKCRDLLDAFARARNPERKFLRDPMMKIMDAPSALEAVREAFAMAEPPHAIEAFDISHISGSFVVASLVRFKEGVPEKSAYRRFKIRGDVLAGAKNDDVAAMREVVRRRYARLVAEGKKLPDLIVVDGGAAQLKSALAAFLEEGLTPPMMVGLAKRNETFVFSDGRPELTLPRSHEGLRLLQRVRDEAHRVANAFNAELRSRRLKQTILDDCPGIGPKRRAALLEKFPTLERLRAATEEALAEVVGKSAAKRVRGFLTK